MGDHRADEHSLELLEFRRVREAVAAMCRSHAGSELVRKQPILTDPDAVSSLRRRSVDFHALLDSGMELPELDLPDIGAAVELLAKSGIVLDQGHLARIGRFAGSSEKLRRYLGRLTSHESLRSLAERLPQSGDLAKAVFRIVDAEGRVREKQIPELRDIARRLGRLRKEVAAAAAAHLNDPDRAAYWQERQPMQRDGRTVLPLKVNFKGRIPAVAHELSASGATLFIEPLDMVEANNEVVQAQDAYRNAVRRILGELSAHLAARIEEIRRMRDGVGFIDSLLARARYAAAHGCSPAVDVSDRILLLEARHPLLGKGAVPITVRMEAGCRMLIITGPNMGGKTVSLKTVGLLSLMNQFGMEIPAVQGTELPIFDDCLADIGDEQSIQQSLSTFSAHIANLSRIAEQSTSRSLVLLDELGAGTDPEEGTAIAMALLDVFITRRSFALATTHHGVLKHYGYTKEGVQNASMEFDGRSLQPTFRIIMGVPGESYALEIARQVGMESAIVEKARGYLSDERTDMSELLARLTAKERELLEIERRHRSRENELESKRREADGRLGELANRERELREKGVVELRRFLDESRRELDGLIRAIREGELTREKTRTASDFLAEIRAKLDEQERRVEESRKTHTADFTIRPGMEVTIRSSGKRARVLRKSRGGRWLVETGSLKVAVGPEELFPLEAGEEPEPAAKVETSVDASVERDTPAVAELDVRGLRSEEALQSLEKQIDSAVLTGLSDFSVIHGKGEGILQRAVHQFLSGHPAVEEYRFAPPELGGYGKTVIRLKGG